MVGCILHTANSWRERIVLRSDHRCWGVTMSAEEWPWVLKSDSRYLGVTINLEEWSQAATQWAKHEGYSGSITDEVNDVTLNVLHVSIRFGKCFINQTTIVNLCWCIITVHFGGDLCLVGSACWYFCTIVCYRCLWWTYYWRGDGYLVPRWASWS